MKNRLEAIVKKEQFITSQIGRKKLEDVMNALEELEEAYRLPPSLLKDIANYYQLAKRLPFP
ncbi:hypothetical protein Y289_11635 [Listeria monocytogenes]|uniref:Uncharacterized protein n=1 Tax=Listeria monocytogenes TaxID=1639 RepID=A0AAD2MJ67_LISMN|nr:MULTISPECIES: hypothetical protein [Listeria]MCX61178.1 hypothetical protein [Listeria monocytogenes serotype 4b]AGR18813.1 hypothetical protein M640_10845 [Listeria monocytogenes]AGR21531.1 hypothetical protein M644_04080 [Listeria monocytogenes]AGR24637.1 hypothetical protein M645_12115 [Listeria monocytogenes]ALD11489.1 hypothetical protein LM220_23130 [Listeria monocytogenes J1816]